METKMNVLFYGKKTRVESDKLLSVYLRVTINGERFEVSAQRYIEPSRWSQKAGKAKGNSEDVRSLNTHLDTLKNKVYDYQQMILQEGKEFTKEALRMKWYGIDERTHTLVEVFRNHNQQLEALIGKGNSKATFGKYRTTLDHVISFLKWKYKKPDIEIPNITYSFITDFEFWLKSVQNCNHNTTIKYISNLRKIINLCIKNGWLIKDPFVSFKMSKKEVVREILTEEELQTLMTKEIPNPRIKQVRDIFIFSCFTGLAYIDAKKLKRSEIVIGMDGERWIYTRRKKTDTPTRIPLLPVVLEIMETYKDHPQCINQDCLLPVPSNCKLNCRFLRMLTHHSCSC